MVFEAHCMSFPCTELLLFNYAKVNTVFHSMAHLTKGLVHHKKKMNLSSFIHTHFVLFMHDLCSVE